MCPLISRIFQCGDNSPHPILFNCQTKIFMVTQDDGTSPSSLTCHTCIPPLRLIPREVFPDHSAVYTKVGITRSCWGDSPSGLDPYRSSEVGGAVFTGAVAVGTAQLVLTITGAGCRCSANRVHLYKSLKSIQVTSRTSTYYHVLYGSGAHLPAKVGSDTATCLRPRSSPPG
jgi:hypothetical protein